MMIDPKEANVDISADVAMPYCLFSPQVVLQLKEASLTIYADDPGLVFRQLSEQPASTATVATPFFHINPVLSREEYIQKIKA